MVLGKDEKNHFGMFQDWPTRVSKNNWMHWFCWRGVSICYILLLLKMPIKVSRIYVFALTLLPCVEKLCLVPKGLPQTPQTARTSSDGAGALVSGSRCSTEVTGPTSPEYRRDPSKTSGIWGKNWVNVYIITLTNKEQMYYAEHHVK